MTNQAEIAELRARLDQLELGERNVQEPLTDEQRREKVAAMAEYKAEWEAETARARKEQAALIADRDRIEAAIKAEQAKLVKIGHGIVEVQRGIDVASERYRQLRDPILRELQAGTADLIGELVRIVDGHIAAAFRLLPPGALDMTADLRADIAARDLRVARLTELRQDVERNWWKSDASEGELRSRFEKALAAIPKAENRSGGVTRNEFTEFAKAGGGLWPSATH